MKPMKLAVESQHRVRKAIESGVDKTGRMLAEWRSAQAKAKKQCYLTARDNEKMQDQVYTLTGHSNGLGGTASANNRSAGGQHQQQRTLTDKEMAKLEAKCRKTQEAVRKVTELLYTPHSFSYHYLLYN